MYAICNFIAHSNHALFNYWPIENMQWKAYAIKIFMYFHATSNCGYHHIGGKISKYMQAVSNDRLFSASCVASMHTLETTPRVRIFFKIPFGKQSKGVGSTWSLRAGRLGIAVSWFDGTYATAWQNCKDLGLCKPIQSYIRSENSYWL